MKSFASTKLTFGVVLLISIFMVGCTSTKVSTDPDLNSTHISLNQDQVSPHDWGTILRKVPGLKVTGSYPDLSILMRGPKSVSQSSEPLYVLDGVVLGNSFRELASVADPSNIKKIRVLKGPESAKYGMRGAFGVIEVLLKD